MICALHVQLLIASFNRRNWCVWFTWTNHELFLDFIFSSSEFSEIDLTHSWHDKKFISAYRKTLSIHEINVSGDIGERWCIVYEYFEKVLVYMIRTLHVQLLIASFNRQNWCIWFTWTNHELYLNFQKLNWPIHDMMNHLVMVTEWHCRFTRWTFLVT